MIRWVRDTLKHHAQTINKWSFDPTSSPFLLLKLYVQTYSAIEIKLHFVQTNTLAQLLLPSDMHPIPIAHCTNIQQSVEEVTSRSYSTGTPLWLLLFLLFNF